MAKTSNRQRIRKSLSRSTSRQPKPTTKLAVPATRDSQRVAAKVSAPPGQIPRGPSTSDTKASIQSTRTKGTIENRIPPCPGPKLHIFEHHGSKIDWQERLDENRGEQSGMQGYVFRAEIKGRTYAVKVFQDFDPESIRYYWEAYLGPKVSAETAAYYTDPFYCECRAYGRITEGMNNGTLRSNPAVLCYGYMYLTAEDEKKLEEKGCSLRYEDSDSDSQVTTAERPPIRAIVKKLAPQSSGVTVRRQGKILMNIQALNKLGIYNRDIRAENFRDGLLVDFGSSLTEPNVLLDNFDEEEVRETYLQDKGMFEDMLNDEKIKITVDMFKSKASDRVLRSYSRMNK